MDQPPEKLPNPEQRSPAPGEFDPRAEFGCLALLALIGICSLAAFSRTWQIAQDPVMGDAVFDSWLFQYRLVFILLFSLLGLFPLVLALLRALGPKRSIILICFGLISSVCLFLPLFKVLDLQKKWIDMHRKTPGGYTYHFSHIRHFLAQYHSIHGSYPPALMPYWPTENTAEARDAFPRDEYAEKTKHYYLYDWVSKKWTDNKQPWKDDPKPADFDQTGWYRYYSDGKGYIVIGNGPDRDADLDAKESFLAARNGNFQNLIANKYDPTNGTTTKPWEDRSSGDSFVLRLN